MNRFSKKQTEVWKRTISGRHRWNFSVGAVRSGKSYLDYFRIPYRIRRAGKDGLILLMGNTEGTVERNILEPMRRIWGDGLVKRAAGDNRLRLFGRECYVMGADRQSQAAKLQGAGLAYCYGDEVATWNPEVFAMLKSRLDKKGACFDGTSNPSFPGHWLKKFIDSDADVCCTGFTIDDNPFLEPGFREALKKEYRGSVYYDRFILGKWAAAEGRIYTTFSKKHILTPARFRKFAEENPFVHYVMGVDIGGSKSATSFTLAGITAGFSHAVILDEYYDKANKSAEHVVEGFRGAVRQWKELYPRLGECYADSAEQLFVKSFRAAGTGINVSNAKKGPINDRIRAICRLMTQNRFYVKSCCTELIGALENAVWDETEASGDRRLDDGTLNVDSLDSMEYALEPYFRDLLRI